MNCNKYWGTQKLFGHIGTLLHERALYPEDGSIECELQDAVEILKTRRVLI